MELTSKAFSDGGKIPSVYTCDGKNINPPLEIKNVPSTARALVLIMEDPDVPTFIRKDGMWIHWVIYNMPPDTYSILENTQPPGLLGKGTGGTIGYQGPCPPDREHRYFLKLYALDIPLNLKPGATKEEVELAMQGHVLEQTQLMGRYTRSK